MTDGAPRLTVLRGAERRLLSSRAARPRGVAWPNTPPCQGGDRRFKSDRGRHLAVAMLLVHSAPAPPSKDPPGTALLSVPWGTRSRAGPAGGHGLDEARSAA